MLLTYTARHYPDTPCSMIFSEHEWTTLYRAAKQTRQDPTKPYSIADAVRYVAALGGFRGSPSDGPPGLKVIWLGLRIFLNLCLYREYL